MGEWVEWSGWLGAHPCLHLCKVVGLVMHVHTMVHIYLYLCSVRMWCVFLLSLLPFSIPSPFPWASFRNPCSRFGPQRGPIFTARWLGTP